MSILFELTADGIKWVPSRTSAYILYINDHELSSEPNCARMLELSEDSANASHWPMSAVALLFQISKTAQEPKVTRITDSN